MSLLKLIISGLNYIFLACIFSSRSQCSLINWTFLGKISEKIWLGRAFDDTRLFLSWNTVYIFYCFLSRVIITPDLLSLPILGDSTSFISSFFAIGWERYVLKRLMLSEKTSSFFIIGHPSAAAAAGLRSLGMDGIWKWIYAGFWTKNSKLIFLLVFAKTLYRTEMYSE